MSITTTLAALKTRLLLANPTPQPALRRVVTTPIEQMHLAEFPSAFLSVAPNIDSGFTEQAFGVWHHHYSVQMLLFVGSHQSGNLAENAQRCEPWPLALATVLVADLRLGGLIVTLGPNQLDAPLFNYRVGPLPWGDNLYFGLRLTMQITEVNQLTTG